MRRVGNTTLIVLKSKLCRHKIIVDKTLMTTRNCEKNQSLGKNFDVKKETTVGVTRHYPKAIGG